VDTGVNGTGVQETGAWDLEICSAGHPPALVVTARGDVSEVSSPGMLLGVLPRTSLTTTRRRLVPGETLVLYTDGATEGRRGVELFGEARLRQCLIAAGSRGGDATATVTHLLEEVLAFQSGHTSDDVAVVVLRVPSE
jgi:sigma-B regulation protein RsbU (phosphoserine phosphatase)